MYMSIYNKSSFKVDNDWNTPKYVWDIVMPYIPKDKQIWEAFYNDGSSGKYLTSKGYNVIHTDTDFFETDCGEIIITNPPYKIKGMVKTKEKILKRLLELDKPFMLLLPTTTLQTQYFKSLHNIHFQLLIPQTKYNFEKEEDKITRCPFYTLWVCYKMEFERDYYII
jgi:hypothetical protein